MSGTLDVLINVEKVCRVCLKQSKKMKSIFSRHNFGKIPTKDTSANTLAAAMMKVTDVMVVKNDGFPHSLCDYCISLLDRAYAFKVQFDHSYSLLQEHFVHNLKKEVVEPDNTQSNGFEIVISSSNEIDNDNNIETVIITQDDQNVGRRMSTRKRKPTSKILANDDEEEDDENDGGDDDYAPEEDPLVKVEKRETRGRKKKVEEVDDDGEGDDFCDDISFVSVKQERSDQMRHLCPICPKEFTAADLREHVQMHTGLTKYLNIPPAAKVTPSTKFYAKGANLKNEVGLMGDKGGKQILHKCIYCDLEMPAEELRLHGFSHRKQCEFKCNECDRVFKRLNHLNTHRIQHLKECPYKCDHCNKRFVIKKNYDCHVMTHNTDKSDLPHECKYCLKRFANPEHLNRHIIEHTENITYSEKYRRLRCGKCRHSFKDKKAMDEHTCVPIRRIKGMTYSCKVCQKVYKSPSAMYSHTKTMHGVKTKSLCYVCGYNATNIYTHMQKHTGEKRYSCPTCNKRFRIKNQLRQHEFTHTGVKPCMCVVCGKGFASTYNLRVHERIHMGDKTHKCNLCGKAFLEKSYLRKHMRVHTRL